MASSPLAQGNLSAVDTPSPVQSITEGDLANIVPDQGQSGESLSLRAVLPNLGVPGQVCLVVLHTSPELLRMMEGGRGASFAVLLCEPGAPSESGVELEVLEVTPPSASSAAIYCVVRVPTTVQWQAGSCVEVRAQCRAGGACVAEAKRTRTFSFVRESRSGQRRISALTLSALMLSLHLVNLDHFLSSSNDSLAGTTKTATNGEPAEGSMGAQQEPVQLLQLFRLLEGSLAPLCSGALEEIGMTGQLAPVDAVSARDGDGGVDKGLGSTGVTVLHLAAEFGWTGFVEALLRAGADPAQTDGLGNNCVDWAFISNQVSTCEMLLQRGHAMNKMPVTDDDVLDVDSNLSRLNIEAAVDPCFSDVADSAGVLDVLNSLN